MSRGKWLEKVIGVFGVDGTEKIAAYCRENWARDAAHVLRVAKDACENTFLFDFTWDMERTWKPYHFQGEIDWSLIPWGDREFLWQFNRHRFLLCLGQSYQMTGDETYAENYVRLLEDWMDRAQPGDNIDLGPWRTLETGLRAETWLVSFPLVLKSPAVNESFLAKMEKCLRKHQKRLAEHFALHKYISNWGVLESCGLVLLSLVLPDSEVCLETAFRRLADAAQIQVLADGAQWEQSPMYHNEVYHCFLNAYYYALRAGVTVPDVLGDVVRQMAYVDYKWKKPDHTQFAQGDSDNSDLREQITAGAYVLGDNVLKSGGYDKLDYESAWRFGWKACEKYAAMEAAEPDFVSAELAFSGNYYMRSGWTEKDNLLHFHCGETGGGHGHADKLHADLVIRGEDVLVDSGRYTYVDGPDRFWFKEASAHNTILTDGKGFAQCETSWVYQNLCTCLKQQYHEGKQGAFVEGSHMGYWDDGVLINRRVIWIRPDIYVIQDDIFTHGAHTFESFLHLDGKGAAEQMDIGAADADVSGGVHFRGKDMEAYIQTVDTGWSGALTDTEQSSYYNEKHPNRTYREEIRCSGGICRKITVINGGEKGNTHPLAVKKLPLYSVVNDKILSPEEAEGLRILDGEKEYILFLCHREVMTPTDILKWENCIGHGKAVLFDRTKEKQEILAGEVLAW